MVERHAAPGGVRPPNLLLVLTDQQRADALGAVSPWLKTPALDRLAGESVRFERCVTSSPGCIPARVALMTGLYPHNTGVWHVRSFTLPATARTWVRNIKHAGYQTCIVGKTHLHPHTGDLRDRRGLVESWGFDEVIEMAGPRSSAHVASDLTADWEARGLWDVYRADIQSRTGPDHFTVRPSPLGLEHHYDSFAGRVAEDRIRSFDASRPWFCWIGFGGPHEPWDAPEPFASLYRPEDIPPPAPAMTSAASGRPKGELLDGRLEGDAARLAHLTAADIGTLRAGYAAKVSLIDAQVGRLLAAVEDRGELDHTVIVFTSDHGEMNGDHGLMHKTCYFDGAVSVPLLIRTPETAAAGGRTERMPVELLDVGPTLADAAGVPVDHPQWGHSLLPAVRGAAGIRDFALSENRFEVMATDGRWKVAFNRGGCAYLCIDLLEDPLETVNLAGTGEVSAVEDEFRARVLGRILSTQLSDDWA